MFLPVELRRRWRVASVMVIDRGDYAIVRPMPDDPIAAVMGMFADQGPTTDDMRRAERQAEGSGRDAR